MCIEIERRFLIKNNDWEKLISHKTNIIQGYLSSSSEDWIVRIRSEDNLFKLTLKKHISKAKNIEFEYDIPRKDGELIISQTQNPIIKDRLINGNDDIEITLKDKRLIAEYEKNKNKFHNWKHIIYEK